MWFLRGIKSSAEGPKPGAEAYIHAHAADDSPPNDATLPWPHLRYDLQYCPLSRSQFHQLRREEPHTQYHDEESSIPILQNRESVQ